MLKKILSKQFPPKGQPLGHEFEFPESDEHTLGPMQRIGVPMRRYPNSVPVDVAIVGLGAGGGVLSQRLSRAGMSVVGFDAGPFWDTERDWVSDEAGSQKLYWNDLRISGGDHPLQFGSNNSGKGVGGGTVHYAAFCPRFHPSDFRTYTEDSVGFDWPFSYYDLKPYYELMERELPVAGPAYFPWGDPHGYSFGPHPLGGVGDTLVRGCTALGIPVCSGGPVAILSGSRRARAHCVYRGFCLQACKVGAKASTLITHIPDALAHGLEIRDFCMVTRVDMNDDGTVSGVTYLDSDGHEQFQPARIVIVAGYAIESPRLLFNSACPGFEQGLANSSGALGRYLMAQAGNVILGRFSDPIRMYKAPPAHALTEEFYETDPKRDFARGFAIQTVGPLPIAFAKQIAVAKGAWGWGMRREMMDYNHWSGFGLLGEILPHEDSRVEIDPVAKDHYGLPVPHVTFNLHDNDLKLIDFGMKTTMEVMAAAGAEEVVQEARYAHLVGGCRMGNDPNTSIVDGWCRSHDIPNLFVCDGSVFPTQGSANPALTIMSIAARTADWIISQGVDNLRHRGGLTVEPPIRYELAPPDTWGAGIPRVLQGQVNVQ